MEFSVVFEPLDGGPVKIGTAPKDGGAGIQPDSLKFDGDLSEYGPLGASLRLKMDPKLAAVRGLVERFTPMTIYRGASEVWDGRVIAAPGSYGEESEIVVQGQGWGQHTKDDCMDRVWVVSDLSRFADMRAQSTLAAGAVRASTSVSIDEGGITITDASGIALAASGRGGVVLDLGPNNVARRLVVTYTSSNNTANQQLYYSLSSIVDGGPGLGSVADLAAVANNAGASGTLTMTATSDTRRYVHVFSHSNPGYTPGADVWFKITSVQIFTSTAYESGNASIFKASTGISETLDALCPLLATDRSKISTTSLSLPHFPAQAGWKYANEYIDEANSYHGYKFKIGPGRVPEFAALPTDYTYVLKSGEYTLKTPAEEDGRETFNRVVAPYDDAAGVSAYAEAATTYTDDSQILVANGNNTFNVDTSGWANGAAFTRQTGSFNTSPASAAMASGQITTANIAGLLPGKKYRLRFSARSTSGAGTVLVCVGDRTVVGTLSGDLVVNQEVALTGSWQTFYIEFTPNRTDTGIAFFGILVTTLYLDDIYIQSKRATVADRRGFRRTLLKPASGPSNSTVQSALATVELNAHQYPPFKGQINVTGYITLKGGERVHVSDLPHATGEGLLLADMPDPNTGAMGRFGIIQTAEYTQATDSCDIVMDDPRNFIQVLRNRIGLATR